jgi:hypothetical protein
MGGPAHLARDAGQPVALSLAVHVGEPSVTQMVDDGRIHSGLLGADRVL